MSQQLAEPNIDSDSPAPCRQVAAFDESPPLSRLAPTAIRRVALGSAVATLVIGVGALLSWSFGALILVRVGTHYEPMSPFTALCVTLASTGLFTALCYYPQHRWSSRITQLMGLIIVSATGLIVVQHLAGLGSGLDTWRPPLLYGDAPIGRPEVSPITLAALLILGLGLVCLGLRDWHPAVGEIAAALGAAVAGVGAVVLLAYIYGTPMLYGSGLVPMSLPGGISLCLLGASIVFTLGPSTMLVRSLAGPSVGALLLRWFLPLGILSRLAEGGVNSWLRQADRINPAVSAAGLSVASVAFVWFVVNRVAGRVGARIERAQQDELRALRELDAQQERQRRVFETIADGLLIFDAVGVIEYANPAAEQILRRTASQLLGLRYDDPEFGLVGIDGQQIADDSHAFVRVAQSGHPVVGVEQVVTSNGAHRVVSINAAPLFYESGQFAGTVTSFRDITMQRAAENALRESEIRYRSLVESSPDATFVELHGKTIYVNPAGVKLLGATYTRDLYDLSWRDFVHPDYYDAANAAIRSIGPGRRRSEPTYLRLIRLDRSIIDGEMVAVRIAIRGEPAILAIVRDVTEQKLLEQELARLATRDPLTDLFNRRRFEEELELELARTRRYRASGALVFLDLDCFKQVNDTLGHAAGDELLVWIATCLHRNLRESDVIARWGGDEFAILLPNTAADEVRTTVASLLNRIREYGLRDEFGWVISVSMGVALYPQHGATVAALLTNADAAMYAAKTSGRDTYRIFGDRGTAEL